MRSARRPGVVRELSFAQAAHPALPPLAVSLVVAVLTALVLPLRRVWPGPVFAVMVLMAAVLTQWPVRGELFPVALASRASHQPRMATFEQQQLIVDLMERHVVPPERVERVQAVIDGRDPCPPTLIDWLMTSPWRESRCTADGLTGPQIAERAGCTEPTVVMWPRQYAEDGLAGLEDAPGSGGPKTVMRWCARFWPRR